MRDTTRSAVVAALAILAVAFAAATLNSTTSERGGSGGSGVGSGDGGSGLLSLPQSGPPFAESTQIPFLQEALLLLAVVAVAAVLVYLFVYWRPVLKAGLALAVVVVVLFVVFRFLSSSGLPPSQPRIPTGNGSVLGGGGGSDGTGSTQPSTTPLVFLGLLALALVGVVAAVLRAKTGGNAAEPEAAADAGADAAAVGRAAGRAADRIEQDAAVDNEVYRTWREMTDLLDVPDPETSTPGEFADAAVEAGMGRDDVDELTRLFEDVRYGDEQPTAEHERRAAAVFRRIEAQYAEDES